MIRRFLLGLILLGVTTVTYGQEDAKEAKVTWDDHVSAIFRQRCVTSVSYTHLTLPTKA